MGRTRISPKDRAWLAEKAAEGMAYRDLAEGIKRPIGSIKTALRQMRQSGLVQRRYIDWASREIF